MPVAELYRRQAALLVSVVPFVAVEKSFALKGGTAINLFVRDLPRISVDLDLAYLPVADRDTSLTAIDAALRRVTELHLLTVKRSMSDVAQIVWSVR